MKWGTKRILRSYSQKQGPTSAKEIGCQGVATSYIEEYNVPK